MTLTIQSSLIYLGAQCLSACSKERYNIAHRHIEDSTSLKNYSKEAINHVYLSSREMVLGGKIYNCMSQSLFVVE